MFGPQIPRAARLGTGIVASVPRSYHLRWRLHTDSARRGPCGEGGPEMASTLFAPEPVSGHRISLAQIDAAVSARLGRTRGLGDSQPACLNRQVAMYLASTWVPGALRSSGISRNLRS
jgi:hypothetical protein